MLILPAIDLRGGKCVRLLQGDYEQETVYDSNPAKVAASFEQAGAEYIHVVDLDGAKEGAPVNKGALRSILNAVKVPIEFGGGIRSLETAEEILGFGVARVVVGTTLVANRALAMRFFDRFGEAVVAGIDAREGRIAISGWLETANVDVLEFAYELQQIGAKRMIVTDIARDGALAGPNLDFFENVLARVNIPVIASGGVTTLKDLEHLKDTGVEGVIIGKALYERHFGLDAAIKLAR